MATFAQELKQKLLNLVQWVKSRRKYSTRSRGQETGEMASSVAVEARGLGMVTERAPTPPGVPKGSSPKHA